MCGRTACALEPENIRKACSYRDLKTGRYRKPDWKESNCGLDYKPSLNIAPTDVTPVLIDASHLQHKDTNRILYPMVWGMVPPWHKGNYKSHGLSTNNCRLEGLTTSKLYGPAMTRGLRCVVLCEGFYEWQTTKKDSKSKQPYYIYATQPQGICIEDSNNWNAEWSEENGWQGPHLLMMAGLFSSWTSPEGKVIHSYSVITMESNETLSWLHHRMPAILRTDDEVADWLDCGRVQATEALKLLKPVEQLSWHPVDSSVNNSRNKLPNCNKRIADLQKPKITGSSKLMQNWLKKVAPSSTKTQSNRESIEECEEDCAPEKKKSKCN